MTWQGPKQKHIFLKAHEDTSKNRPDVDILRYCSQPVNQTTIMNKNFRINIEECTTRKALFLLFSNFLLPLKKIFLCVGKLALAYNFLKF